MYFKNLKINWKFFLYYFCLFLAARHLNCCIWVSLAAASGGYSLLAVLRVLIAVASLFVEHRLQVCGLQQLWNMGLVALQHVGSPWTRDRTYVPCFGRRILNHWTTREVPYVFLVLCTIPIVLSTIGIDIAHYLLPSFPLTLLKQYFIDRNP